LGRQGPILVGFLICVGLDWKGKSSAIFVERCITGALLQDGKTGRNSKKIKNRNMKGHNRLGPTNIRKTLLEITD
jgi:hypothetical protein